MTTTVRVETSEKPAVVCVRNEDGSYQPDVKVEPYDSGTFHIHGEQEISVREAVEANIAKPDDELEAA